MTSFTISLFKRNPHCPFSPAGLSVFAFIAAFFAVFLAEPAFPFSAPGASVRSDDTEWPPILTVTRDSGDRLFVLTSEKGGLYSSENGGKSWRHLGGKIPPSYLFSLNVSPEGPLFLSTFDELLISTDGGEAWKSMQGGGFIRFFTATPQRTYIGVHWNNGLLWASGDDPKFEKAPGEKGEFPIMDVLNPGTERIWAASFGGGVLFSDDGGRTWSSDGEGATNPFVLSLAWNPGTKTLFAGTLEGGVFRRENGGRWIASSEGLPSKVSVQALTVAESGAVWAGTHGSGLFVSPDDGKYWYPVAPGEEGGMSVTSLAPFLGGILAGTSDRGLFFAENRHSPLKPILPSDPVVGLDETETGGVLALSRSGKLHLSKDGGVSWRSAGSTGGRMPASFILSAPGGRIFAGTKGGILLSEDGGRIWSELPFPSEEPPFTMIATDDGSLIAATGSGGLYRSPDGFSWQQVEGIEGEYMYSLDSPDGVTIALGTDRGFSVSGDGGVSWKNTYINYGIHSLTFAGTEMIWGCSRNGFWGYSVRNGEVKLAKISGYEWSPLSYLTDVFSGEEGGLFALLSGSLVRLVPGEGKNTFSMERAVFSNAEVLSSLAHSRGGVLLGTRRGFFRLVGGTSWLEIELP